MKQASISIKKSKYAINWKLDNQQTGNKKPENRIPENRETGNQKTGKTGKCIF